MAHYAFLDENNTVTEVIVGVDETELINGLSPEDWYSEFKGQRCLRTSYNNNIRKQYAAVGYSYDEQNDIFIKPQPYPSWSLDENFDWKAPISRPEPTHQYWWDEATLSWVAIPQVTEEVTDQFAD